MGLKCQISYSNTGQAIVTNSTGNISKLYTDALALTQNQDAALNIWASAFTPEFEQTFGKAAEGTEPSVLQVVKFYQSLKQLDGRLTTSEVFEAKQMMRSAGIRSLSDLSATLKDIFLYGDIPTVDTQRAIESGLFLPEDLPNIDLPKVVDFITRLEGETLYNDFEVEPENSQIKYRNTANKNVLGASEFVTIEQIDAEIIDLIDDFQSEDEFYGKIQELPYTDFVARFYEDTAFAQDFMSRFNGMAKVPVGEEVNGEIVVENVTTTAKTVKNTILDGLDDLDINADISFINSIADNVWDSNVEAVTEVVKEIESELATKNIDIIGLHRITTDKDTLVEILDAVATMVANPTVQNIENFAAIYDKTFLKQPAKKVVKVPTALQGLSLVSLTSPKTDQQLFEEHGLIKVGDNLYHKISLEADISDAYEYLYQQMQDGNFEIPYQYRTETNLNNKTGVLQDIAEYVNGRDTGLGYYNETASLYQLVFNHPKIDTTKVVDDTTSALNTIRTDEVYLKTDFVSDFYGMILQEKIKDSAIYRNTLSKIGVTDNDLTITSDLIGDLTNIPMYQEFMDYMKLRKSADMKKYLPSTMYGDTNQALATYNFPQTIEQYTGPTAEVENVLVTAPIAEDFIRVGDNVYQKVKNSETASVFLRLKNNTNPTYYTTQPAFANFTQELIDRAATTDMVSNSKLTATDVANRKEKSGILSRIVTRIKARNKQVADPTNQRNAQAFENNLIEFLRQKGVPVVTDAIAIRSALQQLGIDNVNQMFEFSDMGVQETASITINGNRVTVAPRPGGKVSTQAQAYAISTNIYEKINKYLRENAGDLYRPNMVVRSGNTIITNIPADLASRVQALRELNAEIDSIVAQQRKENAIPEPDRAAEELQRGVSPDVLKDLGYNMLETPAGNILGFEYQGTIYLDPANISNITTLHELIHVFQKMTTIKAEAGDEMAQKILQKKENVFGDMAREWEAFHKLTADSSGTNLPQLLPGEFAPQFQLGLITLTEQEVLKYARAGIDNKYEAQAIKQIGLQGVNFDKASIKERIDKEIKDLLKRTQDFVFSEDSKAIDGAIQNEIDTMINQGSSQQQIEEAQKALQPGQQRDRVINEYKKAQLDTIKQWTDYLSESDYSSAFKYLILDAVLTNNYNFKTDEYQKRNKKTIRNFTPFDAGTLAELYASESNALLKDYVKIQVENTANIVDNSKFSSTGEGEWLKFNGGSGIGEEELEANANKLSQLVQNTYWCTKTNAKSQLSGGDFYVYTTKNTDGSYSPRVAVRMEGDKVGEVRGNASSKQDLEPEMLPVAEKFLTEKIPNNSGKKWLDSIAYNTKVKEYTEKIKNKPLDLDDISEYLDILKDAKKYSVDYGENGLVKTLRDIFEKSSFTVPVAFNTKEINENTVAVIGDVYFREAEITGLNNLKIITGRADFSDSKIVNLGSLQSIGGSADFSDSNVEDLGSLQSIGGVATFRYSKIKNLSGLKSIGGTADLYGTSIESLGSLQVIGGDAQLTDSNVKDLGMLETIEGNAYLQGSNIENLGILKSIGGQVIFRYTKVKDLALLKSIGTAFFGNSLITDLGTLESIRGDAFFGDSIITDLGTLESIGGDAFFNGSTVENLGILKNIGRDAHFENSSVVNLGTLERIGGNVSFNNSSIKNLGKLERIKGSADFSNSNVENLGNLEFVGTSIWFNDKIKDLGKLQPVARGRASFGGNTTLEEQYRQRQKERYDQAQNKTAQFLVLGEKAATALDTTNESTFRIDNLRVAREMEQAEKTPQEIRVATGWEKGSDGLWRYEELDGNLKITSFEDLEKLLENKEKTTGGFVRVPLTDLLETEDFSKDYLNAVQNISVYFDKAVPIGQAYLQSMGIHINRFSAKYNEDFTQDNALDNFRGMLLHELQHYVQREEGFSEPFSEEEFKFRIEYEIDFAKEELEKIKRISEFEPSYKELIKPQEGVIKSLETKRNTPQEELDNWYWKSYGEIEARNVQTRMNMTPEQRRQTLLSQTEDVAKEDQIMFQTTTDVLDILGIDLSAPVYAQRPGESNEDYHTRLVNEVEAYVTAPEIAEKLENLRQSNPGIWSKIVDFLKNLKAWLASQIGFQDYQGDILEMTKEQYTSALGVSILKDSYDDLFIPQTGKKIANEVMNAAAVLDSQVEIIPLQTDEVQDTLFDKIDNCG
jgi:hypothetical protein